MGSLLRVGPSKAPSLNSWDVPEAMPGAQPGASTVERAEFERRCKNVWRENQQWEHANEVQKNQENNLDECQDEGAVSELMMAFPGIDESVIREVYLSHNSNATKAAESLIVLGGQPLIQIRKKTEPPKIESADMFPSLINPDGWEVVPHNWAEPEKNSAVPSRRERAVANASVPAPKPVSTNSNSFGAWGPPLQKKEKTADKFELNSTYDYFELRKYRGRRRETRGKNNLGKALADDAIAPDDCD